MNPSADDIRSMAKQMLADLPGHSPSIPTAPAMPQMNGLPVAPPPMTPSTTVPSAPHDGIRAFVRQIQSAGLSGQHPGFSPFAGAVSPGVPKQSSTSSIDLRSARSQFPILNQKVHGKPLVWFDNAATTQKPQCVIDAISQFYATDNSNIHRAAHSLAARATDAFENARETVQRFIGAGSSQDIVFVRGTTEGINLIAQTYGRKFFQPGDEILVSILEHHANIVPWQMIAKETGAVIRVIPVNDRGDILMEEYSRLLSTRTKLVALTHANNSIGTILPIAEMIAMARRVHARVLIDAAQSVAHLPINVRMLDADFLVFSGHKLFAPTGIGAVYIKPELAEIMPPWQGGGNMIKQVTFEETTYQNHPAKFEAGTPNIADAVGLAAAIDFVQRLGLPQIANHEHHLLQQATAGLYRINSVRIIGEPREKVALVSFVIPGMTTEEIGKELDREGIAVRSGHHCAQPSLRRFGLDATVRPSFSLYNTSDEVDHLIRTVKAIVSKRAM